LKDARACKILSEVAEPKIGGRWQKDADSEFDRSQSLLDLKDTIA